MAVCSLVEGLRSQSDPKDNRPIPVRRDHGQLTPTAHDRLWAPASTHPGGPPLFRAVNLRLRTSQRPTAHGRTTYPRAARHQFPTSSHCGCPANRTLGAPDPNIRRNEQISINAFTSPRGGSANRVRRQQPARGQGRSAAVLLGRLSDRGPSTTSSIGQERRVLWARSSSSPAANGVRDGDGGGPSARPRTINTCMDVSP